MKLLITLFYLCLSLSVYAHGFSDNCSLSLSFFDRKGFTDWGLIENHLIKSRQESTHVKYFGLEKVKKFFLSQGFEVYEEVENLYQARKRVLERIGFLVPSLNIDLAPNDLSSVATGLSSGLLNFLVPSNWFKWLEARQFYNARKYAFLNTILDKQSLAEILYYKIHLAKIDYETASFFKGKINNLVSHFKQERELNPNTHRIDETLLGLLEVSTVEMNSNVYELRKEALKIIPSLATQMGFGKRTAHIDIKRINLPDLEKLEFLDLDETVKKAKKNSLEVKYFDYLIKAAKYTRSSHDVSFLSSGKEGDYRSFGLSFGLDKIAKIQIAKSEYSRLEVERKKILSLLDQTVSSLVFLYNESIQEYKTIVGEQGDYAVVLRIVKETLEAHNRTGEIKTDVHHLDFLFRTTRRINEIKHKVLSYKTLIDRYLVSKRLKGVLELLPINKELKRLKSWASHHLPGVEKRKRRWRRRNK